MLKLAFILATLGVVFIPLQAGISAGVLGGLNLSDVYGDKRYTEHKSPLLGCNAGGMGQIGLNEQICLQPELLFTVKGMSREYDATDINGNVSGKIDWNGYLQYLQADLLVKMSLEHKGIKYQPVAGFYAGYLLSAKWKMKGGDTAEDDFLSECNRIDPGVCFGADIVLPRNLVGGFRLDWGLKKLYRDGLLYEPVYKNISLRLHIGFLLNKHTDFRDRTD